MEVSGNTIIILPVGKVNNQIMNYLNKILNKNLKKFNLKILNTDQSFSLKNVEFNSIRKQYDASKILYRLLDYGVQKHYFRTLGVIDEDIYSNNLNFVFGVASPPRNELLTNFGASLISIVRLRESFYGRDNDQSLFRLRTIKEATHELGHTFGLKHCTNHCIMSFSNHLKETDDKPIQFCDSCYKTVQNFLKNF